MKRFLLALVRFYRKSISPLRPPCCRFIPTCSQYALEAIEKYGSNVLKLYLPGEYLGENVISDFEKQFGVRVIVENFDSN